MSCNLFASRQHVSTAALIAGIIITTQPHLAVAAGFEALRSHRAVYEVSLDKASDRSGIQSMSGRIVYELLGNACEGITVRYRFVSKISANGEIITSDQHTSTYESPDGNEYNFLTKSLVNEQHVKTVKGVARNTGEGLEVKLDEPEKREISLPPAKFISAHILEVLNRARKGESFFSIDVFDGGDNADEILRTTNVVGQEKKVTDLYPKEKAEAVEPLKNLPAWPVTIGYFNVASQPGAETQPVYEVAFDLYENGISRNLSMRYPDYSLKGVLVGLEMLEQEACTPEK